MGTLLARVAPYLGSAALLVIAALCAALALTRDRLADVRKDLHLEQALHQTDIATFKAAQAKAEAQHLAEIDRLKTENRRQTDEADRRADAARSDYAARVLRIPAARSDSGLSCTGDVPGAGVPQSADRSGGDTILLARADALILCGQHRPAGGGARMGDRPGEADEREGSLHRPVTGVASAQEHHPIWRALAAIRATAPDNTALGPPSGRLQAAPIPSGCTQN